MHYIEWIYLVTEKGAYKKVLTPNDMPEATFNIGNEKPLEVYACCNLHGLWMTKL